MQPAFCLFHPAPAGIPLMPDSIYRLRARLTPYAFIPFGLQRMNGQPVLVNIRLHLFIGPAKQGMIPDGAMPGLLFLIEPPPVTVLVGTNAVDPHIILVKQCLYGLNLVKVATVIRVISKQKIALGIGLHALGHMGQQVDHVKVKKLCDKFLVLYGFSKMKSCVDKVNGNVLVDAAEHMEQDHAAGLKAGRGKQLFPRMLVLLYFCIDTVYIHKYPKNNFNKCNENPAFCILIFNVMMCQL